jgi:hypothetical protein
MNTLLKNMVMAGVLTTASGVWSQNLLVNGGFETPTLPRNGTLDLPSGYDLLPGWTIGGSGIVWLMRANATTYSDPPPKEGDNKIAFNSGNRLPGRTWISQSLDTDIGEVYELNFYVGRGGGVGDVSLTAAVYDETGALLRKREIMPPAQGWTESQRVLFKAVSKRTTVEFKDSSTETIGVDVELDAVSVSKYRDTVSISVSQVAISWESVVGASYQVQYSLLPGATTWVDFGSAVTGNGNEMTVFDAVQMGKPDRVYRVIRLP